MFRRRYAYSKPVRKRTRSKPVDKKLLTRKLQKRIQQGGGIMNESGAGGGDKRNRKNGEEMKAETSKQNKIAERQQYCILYKQ